MPASSVMLWPSRLASGKMDPGKSLEFALASHLVRPLKRGHGSRPPHGCCRSGQSGRESLGTSIQDDALGRTTIPAVELSPHGLRSKGKEFLCVGAPAMDYRCFGLFQRNGLHTDQEDGADPSKGWPSCEPSGQSAALEEEREVPEGKGRFRKHRACINIAPHQCLCVGSPCTLSVCPLLSSSFLRAAYRFFQSGTSEEGKGTLGA